MSAEGTVNVSSAGAPSVTCTTVAQLEMLADRPMSHTGIAVADTASAISADLALRGSSAILALLPNIISINVSDRGAIVLTAAQALTGGVDDDAHSALTLATGGSFAVAGATVAQLRQLGRLAVPPDQVGVTDCADAVIANLERLRSHNGRVRVALTDQSLTAAQVPPLVQLASMFARGVPVRDSAIPIAALADGEDAASIAYLNVHGAELSADGVVTVADIAALSRLTRFSKAARQLIVWDSAARLTAGQAEVALASPLIDGVFLRAEAGAVTLSAAAAVALFAIRGFSPANPDGSANRVTVADSAAQIEAVHPQLFALGSLVNRIVVNANATIDETTLAHLQALRVTAGVGVALIVRDTAANIAAAALGARGPSINAAAWTLSSGAIVSTADALALARRPHFSPAPYKLTLASDTVLTVNEARTLATLASALSTGGHTVTVRDTEANLLSVSNEDAWTQATTLTLTGSDTVSVAAAEELLRQKRFVLGATLSIAESAANLPAATEIPDVMAAALPNFNNPSQPLATARPQGSDSDIRPMVTLGDDGPGVAGSGAIAGPAYGPAAANTHAVDAPASSGLTGAKVNVYGETGSLLSATVERQEGFTVTAPDGCNGQAFSITESVDGRESAPVVVLDAATLENAVSAANARFAASGAIEVHDGKYLDLFTAGSVPVLDRPALVYDPSAHSIALNIPGQAPLRLIVLGAAAPPAALDVSEILVRQAG